MYYKSTIVHVIIMVNLIYTTTYIKLPFAFLMIKLVPVSQSFVLNVLCDIILRKYSQYILTPTFAAVARILAY